MAFEQLPLLRNSLRILKFWSLLLRDDWKRYACLVPALVLNISQFVDILITNLSLDAFIRDAYVLVLWFNSLMRASSLVYNRRRYEKFMEELSVVYWNIRENEGKELNQLLQETNNAAKKLQDMNMAVGVVASIGITLYPFFTGTRAHPFGMFIPGVNKYESPWYELVYLYQFVITPAGCCMYIPFTSLVIAFIMFGILMCKVVQHHLRNLQNLKPEDVWPKVVWCIHYQKKIIRYVGMMNSLTTYIYLMEFITFGALLCALLFLLNVVHSITQVIILCTYITMIFSQVAAMYWYANELSDQSTNLAVAVYDSNWFEFDSKTKKALLLFLARAQIPCAVLVGNIYPMPLEMFQSLLNVTYSYFTLLRGKLISNQSF